MVFAAPEHAYEELREVVINILLDASENGVDRFETLLDNAARELLRNEASDFEPGRVSASVKAELHPNDVELVLEIVWDLFRQGIVTFGLNAAKPGWPWLRLSRFGECILQHGAYRLHNRAAFLKALEAIDLSSQSLLYMKEAVAAFYAGRLLSSAVMLGLAAECEFLRLVEVAKTSRTYGKHFAQIGDGLGFRAKSVGFRQAIKSVVVLLTETSADEVEESLSALQSIARTARSRARCPSRDEVYVYLQLFVSLAEPLMRLRRDLAMADYPRLAPAR